MVDHLPLAWASRLSDRVSPFPEDGKEKKEKTGSVRACTAAGLAQGNPARPVQFPEAGPESAPDFTGR